MIQKRFQQHETIRWRKNKKFLNLNQRPLLKKWQLLVPRWYGEFEIILKNKVYAPGGCDKVKKGTRI